MKILRPLRIRDFALLWSGMAVSLLGDGIYLVTIAWQVYDLSNSPAALALVGLAWAVGMLVFILTGGLLSDRLQRRRVMIASDIGRALAVGAAGVLSLTGNIEVWHLIVLALAYGAGEALFGPAFHALVPDIVGAEGVVDASALEQVMRQGSLRLLGPALGGFVVDALGAGAAFCLDAGSFLVSACFLALLRVRSGGSQAREERPPLSEDLRGGLEFVRSRSWLWGTLIVAGTAMLFFYGPKEVLVPYVIRNHLHGSAADFGWVLAADGVGSILASLALSQGGVPRRHLTFMYCVWGVSTLSFIGYALGSATWQLMLMSLWFGACITAGLIVWTTLLGTRVPTALRGRVNSLDWFISIGLAPVSFALTGPVATALGARATLILAGTIPTAVTLVLLFALRLPQQEQRMGPLNGPAGADAALAPPDLALDGGLADGSLAPAYAGAGDSSSSAGTSTPAAS
jgi:DHA3 family tetracycline resistance protein-like MFS transporter